MAKVKGKLNKQRDPFFNEMIKKKSGAHIKSKKAQRQKDKIKMKKDWL